MANAATVAAGVPAAVSVPTDAEIERRFLKVLPELESRARAIARSVTRDLNEQEETAAEVLAMCWANYRQAARRGKWPSPGMAAWFAWHSVKSGRTLAGQSSQNDVLDPRATWSGDVKVLHLGPLMRGRCRKDQVLGRRADGSDLTDIERLVRALATSERENPLDVARQRIDWRAFAESQDRRTATILAGIVEGRMGKEIAQKLGVSQGRLCQVMDAHVRPAVADYFTLDPVTGKDTNP